MAKQNGAASNLYVDGVDISGSVTALSAMNVDVAQAVNTGIDKSALERIALRSSGTLTVDTWFDPLGSHLAFATAGNENVLGVYTLAGGAGAAVCWVDANQASYALTEGADASFTGAVTLESTSGNPLLWGRQLTAGTDNFTGAADTASHDNGAATTGGFMFVVCHQFTGATLDVDLETSSDDAVGDPFATLAGTTLTFTGVGAQIVEIGAAVAVERYVLAAVTGTFSDADLVIGFVDGGA